MQDSDLGRFITMVDVELRAICAACTAFDPLPAAMEYCLFSGGKRIRPVLCLAAASDMGVDPSGLVPAACALELLHTASLIHDDLPAMDDDDMRRGRPTCHRQFDEATAILLGDLLVARSFEIAGRAGLDPVACVELMTTLGWAFVQLCSGQQGDMRPRRENLERVYREKTGALFAACLEFGVIAGRGETGLRAASRELGEAFGILFQIQNDFIDIAGTAAERGRGESSDARNEKVTVFEASSPAPELRREMHGLVISACETVTRAHRLFENGTDANSCVVRVLRGALPHLETLHALAR